MLAGSAVDTPRMDQQVEASGAEVSTGGEDEAGGDQESRMARSVGGVGISEMTQKMLSSYGRPAE